MDNTVVILQSSYIPWKGYFSQILVSDYFIFLDDVQYTVRDWRNRNRIKTSQGIQWLSIPCLHHHGIKINDVEILDNGWQKKHWKSLIHAYSKSKYFNDYKSFFENIYLNKKWKSLSQFNQYIIKNISQYIFNLNTVFLKSDDFKTGSYGLSKLLEILDSIGNVHNYLTGPTSEKYIAGFEYEFENRNIKLEYMDYSGYQEYHQLYKPFVHEVSILDLIFNTGPGAINYLYNPYIKKYGKSYSF